MNETRVAIVATGTANLASVRGALLRLGAMPVVVSTPEELLRHDRVVLPGVGAFGAAMRALRQDGLDDALRQHVVAGRPFLAICLGMQLLADASEESPGIAGLGILPTVARRLSSSVRVPHLGWNQVTAGSSSLVAPGWAYFAHSFAIAGGEDSWQTATSTHGQEFVAALSRGPQLACQFHPELSGAWGADLLQRWWARC